MEKERIAQMAEAMQAELELCCIDGGEMYDEYEYIDDNDERGVFVKLTHDGGGIYEVAVADVEDGDGNHMEDVETALKGIYLDLRSTLRTVEDDNDLRRRWKEDMYAFNGVSRWDFV